MAGFIAGDEFYAKQAERTGVRFSCRQKEVTPLATGSSEFGEEKRLAALDSYAILDTPPEKDFDDIARLAADICGTPIAVINFIGDRRQFFKAEVGLGVRETPFESSFCAKALLEEDFLLVPDATRDSRFDCNPLVTGKPHLRFYAGALLRTAEGLPIGTVCVLDYQPRELSEVQQRTLRVLARQVMAQLEMRRAFRLEAERLLRENETIRREEEKRRTAQQAGRIGTFEIDIATDTIEVSEEMCHIFGLPVQKTYPADILQTIILPEDRDIGSTPESRRNGNAKLDVEYRIRRPRDGSVRWLSRRGRFITDQHGEIVKLTGIVMDITDAKRKEARSAALLALGDRLRDAETATDATRIAAEILGQGLDAVRAGYSVIDRASGEFIIDTDWTNGKAPSSAGRHRLTQFETTVERLAKGETLAVSNVAAADWLGDSTALYSRLGVRSFIKVPILSRGRLVGALFAHDKIPRFWTRDELEFAWGVADRTYASVAKLAAEADQALLNNELSHRLKNTLAMVKALATQTLKDVTERHAVAAFSSRLQALAAAHEILLKREGGDTRLRAVVDKVLSLHAPAQRLDLTGPDLPIGPKAGLSLSLILHELATNALKYGSLSNESGRVAVRWSIEGTGNDAVLVLQWQESGGPPVSEPSGTGFGSRLIRTGLSGTGNVDKRFDPEGVVATFRAPLRLMQETTH